MEKGSRGLVQVFTGNGKGKTSAALGMILRALGHDLRVCAVFFMKGNYPYGEFKVLSRLSGVDIHSFGIACLTDQNKISLEEVEQARQALSAARRALLSGNYDLVVLDEINVAAAFGLISADDILALVAERPGNVELILTGRYADPRLLEKADLVTDMVKVKHPYDQGILARHGLEY